MFVKNEARGVLMVKMVSFMTQINDIILNAELLCHDGAKRIFYITVMCCEENVSILVFKLSQGCECLVFLF